MIRTEQKPWACDNCIRRTHWGKFNCKKCSAFYTSEFKSPRKYRFHRTVFDQPPELKNTYDWLRDNVFPKRYVIPSKYINFTWKRQGTGGAWCNKTNKEIRFAPMPTVKKIYNVGNDGHWNSWSWKQKSPEELASQKKWLYETMLHEMIHLRLPHHKKSFRTKEKELLKVLESKKPY